MVSWSEMQGADRDAWRCLGESPMCPPENAWAWQVEIGDERAGPFLAGPMGAKAAAKCTRRSCWVAPGGNKRAGLGSSEPRTASACGSVQRVTGLRRWSAMAQERRRSLTATPTVTAIAQGHRGCSSHRWVYPVDPRGDRSRKPDPRPAASVEDAACTRSDRGVRRTLPMASPRGGACLGHRRGPARAR